LKDIVYDIADIISDSLEEFDCLKIDGISLQVLQSEETGYKYLTQQKSSEAVYSVEVIRFNSIGINAFSYLDKAGNESSRVTVYIREKDRDDFKFFAKNIGEILTKTIELLESREKETVQLVAGIRDATASL
jgi:cell fate regulator YaaT (PSP1 superfamily)